MSVRIRSRPNTKGLLVACGGGRLRRDREKRKRERQERRALKVWGVEQVEDDPKKCGDVKVSGRALEGKEKSVTFGLMNRKTRRRVWYEQMEYGMEGKEEQKKYRRELEKHIKRQEEKEK